MKAINKIVTSVIYFSLPGRPQIQTPFVHRGPQAASEAPFVILVFTAWLKTKQLRG